MDYRGIKGAIMNTVEEEEEHRIIDYLDYHGYMPEDYQYVWSVDLSFDPGGVAFSDVENPEDYLALENEKQEDGKGCDWQPDRPGQQYYDTYWGWWSTDTEKLINMLDLPVVIQWGDVWITTDGWHRMLIARLAHIKAVPVIKGTLKEQS